MSHPDVNGETITTNEFSLNLARASLEKGGEEIHLTPKECRLLALLIQNAGTVVSRRTFMKKVWNTDYIGDTRTLDVHICWLRQKVEDDPSIPSRIVTKRGQGYQLRLAD
ncbi:MAG: hypothetical protein B6242_04275 [Anaerolineaceae bacterium 4572_78]|nr:MAG: hypothetical protein B6242_04275 [Anaerolineaceae bacterium 4572_78]